MIEQRISQFQFILHKIGMVIQIEFYFQHNMNVSQRDRPMAQSHFQSKVIRRHRRYHSQCRPMNARKGISRT